MSARHGAIFEALDVEAHLLDGQMVLELDTMAHLAMVFKLTDEQAERLEPQLRRAIDQRRENKRRAGER